MSEPDTKEWTITVWSDEGATDDVEALVRFADALDEHEELLGSAASLDRERGMLSATFTVVADDEVTAVTRALLATLVAFDRAGVAVPVDNKVTLVVAPPSAAETGDLVEDLRFAGRLAVEREEVTA